MISLLAQHFDRLNWHRSYIFIALLTSIDRWAYYDCNSQHQQCRCASMYCRRLRSFRVQFNVTLSSICGIYQLLKKFRTANCKMTTIQASVFEYYTHAGIQLNVNAETFDVGKRKSGLPLLYFPNSGRITHGHWLVVRKHLGPKPKVYKNYIGNNLNGVVCRQPS